MNESTHPTKVKRVGLLYVFFFHAAIRAPAGCWLLTSKRTRFYRRVISFAYTFNNISHNNKKRSGNNNRALILKVSMKFMMLKHAGPIFLKITLTNHNRFLYTL